MWNYKINVFQININSFSTNGSHWHYFGFRYDWYQTETHVIVTLMIKNVKQENVNVEYGDQTVRDITLLQKLFYSWFNLVSLLVKL